MSPRIVPIAFIAGLFAGAGVLVPSCSSPDTGPPGPNGLTCQTNDDCDHGLCVEAVSSASAKKCKSLCETYCEAVSWSCTGANQLFADNASCLASCDALPEFGDLGDLDGDTVQCRLAHAQAAADDASHCVHASPGGANSCGPWCDVYCRNVMASCTGANAQYASFNACLTDCGAFQSGGRAGDLAGDTVQCRQTHAIAAAGDVSHCIHAGKTSTNDACKAGSGDPCDAYCDAMEASCTGGNTQYASRMACTTACNGFSRSGLSGDLTGNTLQCRQTHAAAAASDPGTHCVHAGQASTPDACQAQQMANPCTGYCDVVVDACTGASTQYQGGASQCLSECASIPATGSMGDLTGDTVQCRAAHAMAAQSDSRTHCVHSGWYGGNACGGWCEVYCRVMGQVCTGANAQYANTAACETACGAFPTNGTPGDLMGNTVQCRMSHARAAIDAPGTHCAHAGQASAAGACQ